MHQDPQQVLSAGPQRGRKRDNHKNGESEHDKPSGYTIGDAIKAAKVRRARLPQSEAQQVLDKLAEERAAVPKEGAAS